MTSSPASGAVMITSLAAGGNIHLDMERFLSFSTLGRPGPWPWENHAPYALQAAGGPAPHLPFGQ